MSLPLTFFYESTRSFSAAHRYIQKDWDLEQNRSEFGGCFNPHGHGHDYRIEVRITDQGEQSRLNLEKALTLLRTELDHQHLNHHLEIFRSGAVVPTTENVALFCAERLQRIAPDLSYQKLRLFETPQLWVEIDLAINSHGDQF